eukprot:gene15872-21520_t
MSQQVINDDPNTVQSKATITKKKALPFQLGDISQANILQLRTINLKTLPVVYSDKFYKDLLPNYSGEYMKYAFWNGFVVAAVCARIENADGNPNSDCPDKKLYIMTINVLAPYRRQGIASELLRFVMDKASTNASIKEVYLHVQVSNDEAKAFYLRHGFEEVGIIKDYYKRIEPPDCFLLKKDINRTN